jgi:hypothetical protein
VPRGEGVDRDLVPGTIGLRHRLDATKTCLLEEHDDA